MIRILHDAPSEARAPSERFVRPAAADPAIAPGQFDPPEASNSFGNESLLPKFRANPSTGVVRQSGTGPRGSPVATS